MRWFKQLLCNHVDSCVPVEISLEHFVIGWICTRCGRVWVDDDRLEWYKRGYKEKHGGFDDE